MLQRNHRIVDGEKMLFDPIQNIFFKFIEKNVSPELLPMLGAENLGGTKYIVIALSDTNANTLYEAYQIPVIAISSHDKLVTVAKSLKKCFPDKQIVIAGDNHLSDELKGKDNLGKLQAEAAALAAEGESALPSFTRDELAKGAISWSDLGKSRGLKEVRKQLDLALKRLQNKKGKLDKEHIKEKNLKENKFRRREIYNVPTKKDQLPNISYVK